MDVALVDTLQKIDVYVDKKSNFPARIDTLDVGGTSQATELTNLKINQGLDDSIFIIS